MTVTNPTLTSGAKVFTSSGGAIFTLYGVQDESIQKSNSVIEFPLPLADSDKKIVMDLLGVSRTISVSGILTSADATAGSFDLYEYVQDLVGLGANTLMTGNQGDTGASQVGYSYTSEVLNRGRSNPQTTITVYLTDVSVNATKGNPNSFNYSIQLIEVGSASV